jgi:hypothetical protein
MQPLDTIFLSRLRTDISLIGWTMIPIGLATTPGVTGIIETSVPIPAFDCIHLTGIQVGNSRFVQGQNLAKLFTLHLVLLFLFYFCKWLGKKLF